MPHTRRDFLAGKSLRSEIEQQAVRIGDAVIETAQPRIKLAAGDTLRLTTRAMACDFSVILNPGPAEGIAAASGALELVHELEDRMSVFREHSELSRLNRSAADNHVPVETNLFRLLLTARQISLDTNGACDVTAGSLVTLWRRCRKEARIPTSEEIERTLQSVGFHHVLFDEADRTVAFDGPGIALDLGAIGKGYALDRLGEQLTATGANDWLIHGGHSSILARGDHNRLGGWPVGVRHPVFPQRHMATVLLKNCALSTSGSAVQFFRLGGKRYGHILDPRTGWPAANMLSVTVLAPTAAEADALSTAFFVVGVEKAIECCHNRQGIGVILIPPPARNRKLSPIVYGIPDEVLFFDSE